MSSGFWNHILKLQKTKSFMAAEDCLWWPTAGLEKGMFYWLGKIRLG